MNSEMTFRTNDAITPMDTTGWNDHDRVKMAFTILKGKGYTTRMASGKSACCGSCMAYDIGEKLRAKGIPEDQMRAVYYSRQSNDSYDAYGDLARALWINWSSPNPQEIIDALLTVGLKVQWDGEQYGCIAACPQMTREEKMAAERQARAAAARARYEEALVELASAKEDLSECEDYTEMIRLARLIERLAGNMSYFERDMRNAENAL